MEKLNYITPDDLIGADLIIIATKSNGLDDAIKYINNFVCENTIIISLINGISSEEKIAKEMNINTDYYATETYSYDKALPWDFIEIKPGKTFLIDESKRLVNQ